MTFRSNLNHDQQPDRARLVTSELQNPKLTTVKADNQSHRQVSEAGAGAKLAPSLMISTEIGLWQAK